MQTGFYILNRKTERICESNLDFTLTGVSQGDVLVSFEDERPFSLLERAHTPSEDTTHTHTQTQTSPVSTAACLCRLGKGNTDRKGEGTQQDETSRHVLSLCLGAAFFITADELFVFRRCQNLTYHCWLFHICPFIYTDRISEYLYTLTDTNPVFSRPNRKAATPCLTFPSTAEEPLRWRQSWFLFKDSFKLCLLLKSKHVMAILDNREKIKNV